MTFDDIPSGASVFLDANTFVYHFISDPNRGAACTRLLECIEQKDVVGFVSPHVLAEVSHRLMTLEACWTFNWSHQGVASRLRQHPHQFVQLQAYRRALSAIALLDLTCVGVTTAHVTRAADVSSTYGLLTNDAIVVTLMQDHGLTDLASNDVDFDRVPGIQRYAPV